MIWFYNTFLHCKIVKAKFYIFYIVLRTKNLPFQRSLPCNWSTHLMDVRILSYMVQHCIRFSVSSYSINNFDVIITRNSILVNRKGTRRFSRVSDGGKIQNAIRNDLDNIFHSTESHFSSIEDQIMILAKNWMKSKNGTDQKSKIKEDHNLSCGLSGK